MMYAATMTRPCEGTLTFVADKEEDFWAPPVYQVAVPCHKCKDLGYTIDIITNDISYYGFTKNGRSLIEKCENFIQNHISRAEFLKEQNTTDPSSSSKRVWSYLDFKKLFEHIRQDNLNNIKMNNKVAVGSWLILSPLSGAWNFDTLKLYMMDVIKKSMMTCHI
ncbi:uncharacterized protein LOC126780567 [Nymphalis io]|uniref:uncharacterized protein LOC126780567 n=1 Tax=Inachis io TaxID=171585 RepID=UPI002168AD8E|nr:uncharacterized protein LOC126780567 [Nymphalis io]